MKKARHTTAVNKIDYTSAGRWGKSSIYLGAFLVLLIVAQAAHAAVPTFVDEFTGPTLDPEWSTINSASHVGFNGSGQYVIDGVWQGDAGLVRSMGGEGSFVVELSVELGPFFLGGSGGTQSDFKFRFGGSAGNMEVVLNSFKGLRVSSTQLGGDIANTTIGPISDGDTLDLRVALLEIDGSFDVEYAINGGGWVSVVSTNGLTGYLGGNSEMAFYKFGNSPTTLPRMHLDRYEVMENPLEGQVPVANPDFYQAQFDTVLMVPAAGVLTNDTHPLALPLTAVLIDPPALGSLSLSSDGSFMYTPLPGYSGQDSFTYLASDGTLPSGPATVTIDVLPSPLRIVGFDVVSAPGGIYELQWNSEFEKTYTVSGTTNLTGPWGNLATNLVATPPTNTFQLTRPPEDFEAFRVVEETEPLAWPNTDYCAMMAQEVYGKKHGFLAGNLVYYIGGNAGWTSSYGETIGLTHPFFHDLRSRGYGIATNVLTGVGHDLNGWEFWRDTQIAAGTVIIGTNEYVNPAPLRMYWRPDRMICEYAVGGIPIYEEKFISTNDVVCSIIKSSVPIQIRFEGQSYVNDGKSIQKTSTQSYDAIANVIHVVEGGTILVKPEEGVVLEGQLMYDGMSTVVSASENFAGTYSGYLDGDGRQQYAFTVPCDSSGLTVCWAMDDVYANARDRVQSVLNDSEAQLATKKAHMNDLLNNQIPYFRCSDQDIVDIYYYLWALHLMYYIDVGEGWEQYPHTQSAVNNFLGMHRYDASFQIRVGAWMTDKDYYAYGNVLIWSELLPYMATLGRLPDNMGTTWHSGIYGSTTDHPNGAWEIFERTGDTNFLADCYAPYFKPLFWNGIMEHWGYMYNTASNLSKMAQVLGYPADVNHWYNLVNMGNINNYLNARWELDTPNWFLSGNPMNWGGMGYMGMEQFPDEWAREMTDNWALNDVDGFFTEVAPSTRALKDWAGVHDQYTITPDTCWWAVRGMYLHHVGTNANRIALNHLKGYNMEWGIPVAPEALDINFNPEYDQYSNFNAGKLLLILEGMAGVDYSIPDGTFTVSDHMPGDWSFMEMKLPVTQPGQTDWVNIRVDRTEGTNGVVSKTVSVTGNPLPTLEIQPWLEELPLVSAPAGYTSGPTNHISYTYVNTTNQNVNVEFGP